MVAGAKPPSKPAVGKPGNSKPVTPVTRRKAINRNLEPIRSGEAYPVKLFEQLTMLGPKGRREAQRNGLAVRGVGKTRYVLGDDWLTYLKGRPLEVLPT